MAPAVSLYNARWGTKDAVEIELECIRRGGQWTDELGKPCGNGLFYHVKRFQQLVWPEKAWHKWNNLLVRNLCESRRVGILGPASSGKTHECACFLLVMYYARPNETTCLCSSTTREMLQLRIWGEIKKWHQKAKKNVDWLPGNLIDSRLMLTTDAKDKEGREFRNGIMGRPCRQGDTYVGLGDFIGVKNKFVFLVADEAQHMARSFYDSISNLSANPFFMLVAMGNPKDPTDALGVVCEPENGWETVDRSRKTKTWKTRLPGGVAIQLVGTDGPNFDYPEDQPPPFPYLITRTKIAEDKQYYGEDSMQYLMMDVGEMPMGGFLRRVITRGLCLKHMAMEEIVWRGDGITKILGMDIACGGAGGDRTAAIELWFGPDMSGRIMMACIGQPIIISVANDKQILPEDQIAMKAKAICEERGIEPKNLFFDGTGRSQVMSAFARLWSPYVVPLEFGGRATDRTVRSCSDEKCCDKYGKFVTELWYTSRLVIEANQMRGLPESVMEEGQLREYVQMPNGKVDVEPKDKTRARMGRSPDLYDAYVSAVEGARRRGFVIENLSKGNMPSKSSPWLADRMKAWKETQKRKELSYATN